MMPTAIHPRDRNSSEASWTSSQRSITSIDAYDIGTFVDTSQCRVFSPTPSKVPKFTAAALSAPHKTVAPPMHATESSTTHVAKNMHTTSAVAEFTRRLSGQIERNISETNVVSVSPRLIVSLASPDQTNSSVTQGATVTTTTTTKRTKRSIVSSPLLVSSGSLQHLEASTTRSEGASSVGSRHSSFHMTEHQAPKTTTRTEISSVSSALNRPMESREFSSSVETTGRVERQMWEQQRDAQQREMEQREREIQQREIQQREMQREIQQREIQREERREKRREEKRLLKQQQKQLKEQQIASQRNAFQYDSQSHHLSDLQMSQLVSQLNTQTAQIDTYRSTESSDQRSHRNVSQGHTDMSVCSSFNSQQFNSQQKRKEVMKSNQRIPQCHAQSFSTQVDTGFSAKQKMSGGAGVDFGFQTDDLRFKQIKASEPGHDKCCECDNLWKENQALFGAIQLAPFRHHKSEPGVNVGMMCGVGVLEVHMKCLAPGLGKVSGRDFNSAVKSCGNGLIMTGRSSTVTSSSSGVSVGFGGQQISLR